MYRRFRESIHDRRVVNRQEMRRGSPRRRDIFFRERKTRRATRARGRDRGLGDDGFARRVRNLKS